MSDTLAVATPTGAGFRLLGPVEVRAGDRLLDLGTAKQRALLAALLADAGTVVTADALIDRVWDHTPPARVRTALHAHLSRIRRLLAAAGGNDVLVRRSGGYAVMVDPERIDLHQMRRLTTEALADGLTDLRRAELLDEALGLWRGEPLAGLGGAWAARLRESLRQQRVDVVLHWAGVALRLGRHSAVIDVLRPLVSEHPLVETLVANLMRALDAAGRTGEALQTYAALGDRLAEELGTDPGAEVRHLHAQLLRGDRPRPSQVGLDEPTLDLDPKRTPDPPKGPAHLPPDLHGFTGRAEEIARLDAVLAKVGDQPSAPAIAVLSGTAGVGKTALAVHWAHRAATRYRDGQLYVNLRGFTPGGTPLTPEEALRGFLDALDVPPARMPVDLGTLVGRYRSLLAGRRMLILLDNARDADQVRPLLPGTPSCLVLVTSRGQLTPLVATEGAHPVTLDLLTAADARDFLVRRLGAERVAAEPTAAAEIVSGCGRLPLALAVTAARASTYPDFPLATFAAELRDAGARLDTLASNDPTTDVRAVFSWSYRTLGAEAARLFRLLGLHPGPDAGLSTVAALAGSTGADVRVPLAELVQAHLVSEHSPGRYTFHDLLRRYAAEQARAVDTAADRRAARHRLIDHYLHTARTAARLLEPHREQIPVADPAVAPVPIPDDTAALAWLTTEYRPLLAAVRAAVTDGFPAQAWQLACTLTTFLQRRGHWHDQLDIQQVALTAAADHGDEAGQAQCHRALARAYQRLRRPAEAEAHLRAALDLHRRGGDPSGEARALYGLSVLIGQSRPDVDTLGYLHEAHRLFGVAGNDNGQAELLNGIGWWHAQVGNYRETLSYSRRALDLHQRTNDRHGAASAWDSLGYAHHHLGDHAEAVESYRRAIALFRQLGELYLQAETLNHLAEAYAAAGDPAAAHDARSRAGAILDRLARPASGE